VVSARQKFDTREPPQKLPMGGGKNQTTKKRRECPTELSESARKRQTFHKKANQLLTKEGKERASREKGLRPSNPAYIGGGVTPSREQGKDVYKRGGGTGQKAATQQEKSFTPVKMGKGLPFIVEPGAF